jgi:hypothetical protein
MKHVSAKPKLYVHVKGATHFLEWELPEFKKYFQLVDQPAADVALLCFGPDAMEEASQLPARKRFLVTFPGFGYNPLYNLEIRHLQETIIKQSFNAVFINPGPLELAYSDMPNVYFYPFSVNTDLVKLEHYRTKLDSLIHVSNDGLQKDWQRSQKIMELTGLKNEVFPPRNDKYLKRQVKVNQGKNLFRKIVRRPSKKYLPLGYVDHQIVIKKYQDYDGFVHVARDIKHPGLVDGKYTASLIEAGITGSILFWHDTLGLGNTLETVFELPLDEHKAASRILDIRKSLNVEEHSRLTHQEMLDTFNPQKSVKIRADKMLELLG